MNFLTVIMPSLGKDVTRSLTTGVLQVTSRFKLKRNTNLPVFLNELFVLAYKEDGSLIDPVSVKVLRQLLLVFYKFEVESSPEKDEEAYSAFIGRDSEVKTNEWPDHIPALRALIRTVMPDDPLDIRCHHSSGRTADRISNSQKRYMRRVIPALWSIYGPEYQFLNERHFKQWREEFPLYVQSPSARITSVPKDSRGPRVICMEPHELMFVQKGLMQLIYDHVEHESPAKGYVNFTDQTVNRRLAHRASLDRSLATIDLKDASDMVSWDLIKLVFPIKWIAALSATRSAYVKIGDINHPLQKFAPMGSALCFPIEAILFWAISRLVCDEVWVFGDDIIVANKDATKVMSMLESYGLIINRDKSLHTGSFRESCGGEYYDGLDVSYVQLKSMNLVSVVEFCNLITEFYGEEISRPLISIADSMSSGGYIRREPLQFRDRTEPLVYYTSYYASASALQSRRWNTSLQCFEVRSLTTYTRSESDDSLKDYDAYYDWHVNSEKSSMPLEAHISRELKDEFSSQLNWRLALRSSFDGRKSGEANSWSVDARIKFSWAVTYTEGFDYRDIV